MAKTSKKVPNFDVIESNGNTISFAEFDLDPAHRRLYRKGEPVHLNAKTFDLLAFLAANGGRIVTKDEILDSVWKGQFVEEANLSVQVSALRKALGDKKDAPRFLITVPGVGYKFVADVRADNGELIIERRSVQRIVVDEEISDLPASLDDLSGTGGLRPRLPVISAKLGITAGTLFVLALAVAGFWILSNTLQARDSVSAPRGDPHPKIKRVTNHGRVNTAVLSPDGKLFAYSFVERGSLKTELRLGQTNGGSETVLRPIADARYYPRMFSPNGDWLYFTESAPRETEGSLYKMPAAGGVPQKLADKVPIWLNVSPDEKQIAFVRDDKESRTSTLVIADIHGSSEREIVLRSIENRFIPDSQAWSADGKFIAVAAANGANHKNTSKRHYEIFVTSPSDGIVRQLTALEWNAVDTIDWLRDGTGLVAVARDKDKAADLQLWQIDYPEGTARLLSRDANTYAGEVSISADSASLLVVHREMEANIWVAPADNLKEASQITFSSSGRQDGWNGMDFAPDGQIVYTAWIDQSLTIWKMDATGQNARQLTSTGYKDEKPAATADGRFIVFHSDRSGSTEIWRMDIDGGNLVRLTTNGGNSAPDVTPDGSWVIYRHLAEDGVSTIWRIPITGGQPVAVTTTESFNARVSPDGKSIACVYEIDNKPYLAILPIEGGEPIRLFDVGKNGYFSYRVNWTADGRSITFPDRSSGIWEQDILGGPARRLKGLPAEMTFSHTWSRDGRSLAFGRTRENREAVLISNFR